MSDFIQRLIYTIAVLAIASCASVRLPAVSSLADHKFEIKFQPASAPENTATVSLFDQNAKLVLATAPSVFSYEMFHALGERAPKRCPVFVSSSGNTVLIHEDASESSPSEQLIVFSRARAEWTVATYDPPHRPGPLYGLSARTVAVDDDRIYFAFPEGPVQSMSFHALRAKPESHASHYHARVGKPDAESYRICWLIDAPRSADETQSFSEDRPPGLSAARGF